MSDPACIGHIDYHTMFATALDRGHVRAGTVHLNSVHLSLIDVAIARTAPNVFMVDVSEPDEDGYLYYGPLRVHTSTYGEQAASLRIVQVNRHQPRVHGDGRTNRIHVSAVDVICESDHELPDYVQPPVTEAELTSPGTSWSGSRTAPPSSSVSAGSPTRWGSGWPSDGTWRSTPRCSPTR